MINIIHIKVINQIKYIILLQTIVKKVYFGQAGASDFTIHKMKQENQDI